MKRFYHYELLNVVQEGPVKTHEAKDIRSDEPAFVHLLTGVLDNETRKWFLELAGSCAEQDPNGSRVIEYGDYAGMNFIVTPVYEPFQALEDWLENGPAAAPPTSDERSSAPTEAEWGVPSPEPDDSGRSSQTPGYAADPTDPATGLDERPAPPSSSESTAVDSPTDEELPAGQEPSEDDTPQAFSALNDMMTLSLHKEDREWSGGAVEEPTGGHEYAAAEAPGDPPAGAIEIYLQSAREHLNASHFDDALEALDQVLELQPEHGVALQLREEALRRKQESEQLHEEKERIYHSAQEQWGRGDLAMAHAEAERLRSLENRHPDPDEQQGALYRELCELIRSEHERIKSAYDEARACLEKDDWEAAQSVSQPLLEKYPGHALFQALKVEIAERERQNVLAFVTATERRVDAEPDLDRRISILREALAQHPDQEVLDRARRTQEEKRDLVGSLVDRAEQLEREGRQAEALDQWRILQSVHEVYPGLDRRINELEELLRQQADHESQAQWMSRIEDCLQADDLAAAAELCQQAVAARPHDAELAAFAGQVQQHRQAREHSLRLFAQGEELLNEGRLIGAIEQFREAYQIDSSSPSIRQALIQALDKQAWSILESDWETARGLVEEIGEIDPTHAAVEHLRPEIASRQKEEQVSWRLMEARRHKRAGDLGAARRTLEEGLEQFPVEKRFKQFLRLLDQQEPPRKMPARAGAEAEREPLPQEFAPPLAGSEAMIETATQPETPAAAEPYPPERETERTHLDQAVLDAEEASAAPVNGAPPGADRTPSEGTAGEPPAPDSAPTAMPSEPSGDPQATARSSGPSGDLRQKLAGLGGLATGVLRSPKKRAALGLAATTVVIVLLAAIAHWANEEAVSPVPSSFPITVQAFPPGAVIAVDGQECGVASCDLELEPGTYEARARLTGYETASMVFEVGDQRNGGANLPVMLELTPLSTFLRVACDLARGEVYLDGESIGALEDGVFEFDLSQIEPGEHTVRVAGGGASAEFTFEPQPGGLPVVRGPIEARSMKAVLVANLGSEARLYTANTDAEAVLAGRALGKVGVEGIPLEDLTEDSYELAVGTGKEQQNVLFDTTTSPVLAAYLRTDRNVGALRVMTGEYDVTIYLNGEKYRRKTSRGRRLIYLVPKEYRVRVEKEGFQTPPEKVAVITKGERVRMEFEMTPEPKAATLAIRRGIPGATVRLDGETLGVISSRGTFERAGLPPGSHRIEITKSLYHPKTLEREFGGGEMVEIDGRLESAGGTLRIEVTPADADVELSLRREGDPSEESISKPTLRLPAGTYTVVARGDGYQDFAATLRLDAGETKTAHVNLESDKKKVERRPTLGLEDWEQVSGWSRHQKLLVRQGGEYVLLPGQSGAGTYVFTALLQRGKRLQWVVNYSDLNHHILYRLGKKELQRIEVKDGKQMDAVETKHDLDLDAFVSVQIDISDEFLVHKFSQGGGWVELDSWKQTGRGFAEGKFGFCLPGRNQIALSHFEYIPYYQ